MYATLLKQMDNQQIVATHNAATLSVGAWGLIVEENGSLLQNWIQGQEVLVDQRYPSNDIIDQRNGYQYFYHSHRHGSQEHGHLHLFYHATKSGQRRYINQNSKPWVRTAPSHLFAVGLDERGLPISIFTVNRWITEGHWFNAETVMNMVRGFDVQVNNEYSQSALWLTGFIGMYLPLIARLLQMRDEALSRACDQIGTPLPRLLNDQNMDVLSFLPIAWESDILSLEKEIERRGM